MGAVIEAFRALKKPCRVRLVTDSMVCVHTLNSVGKKPKKRKNPDLVEKMLKAADGHELSIEYVRGHAGHPENERCDWLAGEALREGRNPTAEYALPTDALPSDATTDGQGGGAGLPLFQLGDGE
jgi:ribonuclease HI